MSWVKLDDQFISHPKVMRAGPEATLLHVWGLCYSAQHLTDGKIPALAITGAPFVKRPAVAVRALVAAGLWHELVDGEYEIHDYLVYNPTAEKVKGERDAAAERMRLLRGNRNGSSSEHQAKSAATSPSPVPVPEVPSEPEPSRATPAASAYESDFSIVWDFYPRKIAKPQAFKAFKARRRDGVVLGELVNATKHYAASVKGKEPDFVMHGATFYGPNERWKDYLDPTTAAPPAPRPQDANGPRACPHCGKGRFSPGTGWTEACDCAANGSGILRED